MKQSHALVEIHYALWVVLSLPLGLAGMFFFLGLMLVEGFVLEAISATLYLYIARLTRMQRGAWLIGLLLHGALVLGAAYYVPRLPSLLGVPLAVLNLYSLIVLLVYRKLWSGAEAARLEALTA